ncbi:hypothetical protein N7U66_02810 [Lacinutrix neustonica]|uniref:Lipocalin-like domain-containing protein n=1 Tax=Lacinutrix neustonica TaxID=2980107 RepID=A0A9E8MXE0_9FLAO|nr:hypothetical protein [Lacinutrix neustonica]WAC02634.1 hypothetical protein N7U66_02810 [Lacinutrix neustonica]
MKKLNVLLIALFLVLSACTSDDDTTDAPIASESILGTWIGQDVDYTGASTTTGQGQSINSTFVGEAYDVDYTLTFTEDPNQVVSNGSYSIELTTTTLGQTQTNTVENLEFLGNGSWSLSRKPINY